MKRKRFLTALIIVVLSFSALVIGVVYSLYSVPPAQAGLDVLANEDPRKLNVMILCPSKASEEGLCKIGERELHANYVATVHSESPTPKVNPTVTCTVRQDTMPPKPSCWPSCPTEIEIPTIDRTSDFACHFVQTDQDRFELDLIFIANPDDASLIAPYYVLVTINYYEPLLPFGLLNRSAMSGTGMGFLCILGYDHIGPAPSLDCEQAALSERQSLGVSTESSYQLGLSTILYSSAKAFRRASLDSVLIRRLMKSGSARILSNPAIC